MHKLLTTTKAADTLLAHQIHIILPPRRGHEDDKK